MAYCTNNRHKACFIFVLVSVLLIWFFYIQTSLHPWHFSYSAVEDWKIFDKKTLENIAKRDHFNVLKFNLSEYHIFVFLHIQKTGGTTTEMKLANEISNLTCDCGKSPNAKKCDCTSSNNEVWIICRYTEINKHIWPCGVHADWMQYQLCAPRLMNEVFGQNSKRKFLFITQLRDPVSRCISEFRHVQRGATWKASSHQCNGRDPTRDELYCYEGDTWSDVPLDEFISCKKNLGLNRQTRMLTNLSLVNCYKLSAMNPEKRDYIMLQSAIENLMSMPYFALMEQPAESQFLFEKTFGLQFKKQWLLFDSGYASVFMNNISQLDLKKVKDVNHLDVVLYEFAKILFRQRLDYVKQLFNEEPIKTKIIAHPKGPAVLNKNWKNFKMKGKRKKNRKKKRNGKIKKKTFSG